MSTLLDWAGVLSGPVGVVAGAVGKGYFDRLVARKSKDEAAQVITDAAITLIDPLKAEIQDLRERVETLETENRLTKNKLQLAINYIRALRAWVFDHIPDKTPPHPPVDLGL